MTHVRGAGARGRGALCFGHNAAHLSRSLALACGCAHLSVPHTLSMMLLYCF
jgi:hypothetical protein